MSKLLNVADRLLAQALVALTPAMVLDVAWQVAARFLLRSPSSFTEELATFLLVWITFLGGAWALRQRSHLAIHLLVARLARPLRQRVEQAAHLLVALFSLLVLVAGGSRLVALAFQLSQVSAATGLPMGVVYLVIPFSGLLMIAFSLDAARRLSGGRERE